MYIKPFSEVNLVISSVLFNTLTAISCAEGNVISFSVNSCFNIDIAA